MQRLVWTVLAAVIFLSPSAFAQKQPNIVVILADDLGYGDLGAYGHPVIETPHLDRMAVEGQRWTSFYAASSVCNPSRAALLSGRLPVRIHGGKNRWADLPPNEITIAEILRTQGYATACIGKWHLGMGPGSHPNDQGFDYFYGLAGSNDAPLKKGIKRTYETTKNAAIHDYDISLYRQREPLESPVQQATLTKRYAEEAVEWIHEHRGEQFFLYLAHNLPHVPLFRSPSFEGHSSAGIYGDVVEEIDWSVGHILNALKKDSLEEDTLVVFSSDNGPWLTYYDLGGSPGPLRDGKMTAWEGGFRVPGIFLWPGTIQPAVVHGMGALVDFIATFASLTGASLPSDRRYDSVDLSPTLLEGKPSPRRQWFYYGHPFGNLWAARVEGFKLHLESWETIGSELVGQRGYGNHTKHDPPLLFDLNRDVSERFDVASRQAEQVRRIREAINDYQDSLRE